MNISEENDAYCLEVSLMTLWPLSLLSTVALFPTCIALHSNSQSVSILLTSCWVSLRSTLCGHSASFVPATKNLLRYYSKHIYLASFLVFITQRMLLSLCDSSVSVAPRRTGFESTCSRSVKKVTWICRTGKTIPTVRAVWKCLENLTHLSLFTSVEEISRW